MRSNAEMDPQTLQALWATDRDAALLEWSYRMLETPSAVEDAAQFSEWLVTQRYGPAMFSRALSAASGPAPLVDGKPLQLGQLLIRVDEEVIALLPARALHLFQEGVISQKTFLQQLQSFLAAA